MNNSATNQRPASDKQVWLIANHFAKLATGSDQNYVLAKRFRASFYSWLASQNRRLMSSEVNDFLQIDLVSKIPTAISETVKFDTGVAKATKQTKDSNNQPPKVVDIKAQQKALRDRVNDDLNNKKKSSNDFDSRLTVLEAKMKATDSKLDKILEILSK